MDTWIAQARQLQVDIERSRQEARDIVQKYEAGKTLSAKVEDASAQVRLLHSETGYNDTVLDILQSIQSAVREVSSIALLVDDSNLKEASLKLSDLERVTRQKITADGNEQAWSLVLGQAATLRTSILHEVQTLYDRLVHLDSGAGVVLNIRTEESRDTAFYEGIHNDLGEVLDALEQLGALENTLLRTSKKLSREFFQPLVSRQSLTSLKTSDGQGLSLQTAPSRNTAQVVEDLENALDFLRVRLPSKASPLLISACLQHLIPALISDWLSAAIPLDLQNLLSFEHDRLKIKHFADWLSSNAWQEAHQLNAWLERLPRMWLTKRRTAALDGVRKAYLTYRGETKTVQRVEREKVTNVQDPLADASGWDDWNAEWHQDQESKEIQKNVEEDASGWDFEEGDTKKSQAQENANDETEAADAWGWDDEEEKTAAAEQKAAGKSNGTTTRKAPAEREIVLKEVYTVTEMPESILSIISRQLEDADTMTKDDFAWLQAASPSTGLRALPALILAMFRATAPSFYETSMSSGNMHLYNDCLYLSERYKDVMSTAPINNNGDDVAALEKFAKSAYAREMDTQRTVLGDLLDGAQGFASCTEYPFSVECETAVTSTVDRIKIVHEEWKTILSQSALLQSTGSLLATIIEKVIKDIEDMEDIPEAESQRLASFCSQISKLDVLFTPQRANETPASEESPPMTAVYVYNWLRFQYLANILESSLVDIKYLWTEGELSLEFTVDEVVDLIKALFADSHHRRNAISEIRRA